MEHIPTLADIQEARRRIAPYAHRTPVLRCGTIEQRLNMQIFFKCENLQKVGAFKFRGACNTVFSLEEAEAARGVATHSSGNHAQALALAARLRGIAAYIVMPENSPDVKKAAVRGYGARITFCPPTLAARESTLAQVIDESGATFVHPYNDYRVIAGQATAALELLEEVSNLDVIMAPVGGGGLLSGTALSAAYLSPATRVIGAEPAGADDACRSLQEGRILPSENPKTIADGLLTSLGEKTFGILREHAETILTATEENIIAAMRLIWERMKIIVEPSAALPVAALMEYAGSPAGGDPLHLTGRRIGIILSGGNLDLGRLPWQQHG